MKVFLTGATGYIGGSVAQRLLSEGCEIRALVRDETKAAALVQRGITPVIGTLDDAPLLTAEAQGAGAVVNAASSDHAAAIDALLAGLRGSGKALLHTSGSSVIGDDAGGDRESPQVFDEDTPFIVPPGKQARAALDQRIRDAAQQGVRSVVLCNSMIYGLGTGMQPHSVQVPRLVDEARRRGVVHVVGSGLNRWSNVHIDDVVALYLLALRGAPAGAFYFVENGEASYLEIGQAIARCLGLGPVQPWSLAQASEIFGEAAARFTFGSNSRVRARRARRELRWAPMHASLTDWIERDMPVR